MNIIIVGTAYPYRGGLAAFNERLAAEYMAQGHKVEIYTFTLQYPNFLFPGKTQYSTEPAPKDLVIHRRVNSCNPFNWIKVGREIRRKRPDMVIIKYWIPFMAPCLGTIARMARKNGHTKVLSILDNVIPHEHRIGDKMFSKYFVHSIHGFVAMSQSVLQDLRLFTADKPAEFCPHPLYDHYGQRLQRSEALQLLKLDDNCRYVLFFGFIRTYKGLDLLLEAFANEWLRQSDVKLIVAGEFYGDSAPYLQQIEQLGIADKVVLCTDFIPDSEVNRYFSVADIVAQPYKTATQSGVTQIAFHFEKPMLVTNVGGLAEIVPDGKIGYVVEPDKDQIAMALRRFFEENKKDEFEANIVEEKQKYSWSRFTDAIETVAGKSGKKQ
ncbi:MAG: glycosyltransferase [Bacteroidales bacterium]|nr:glycosyltransferase [Bacteroidales bacterium]